MAKRLEKLEETARSHERDITRLHQRSVIAKSKIEALEKNLVDAAALEAATKRADGGLTCGGVPIYDEKKQSLIKAKIGDDRVGYIAYCDATGKISESERERFNLEQRRESAKRESSSLGGFNVEDIEGDDSKNKTYDRIMANEAKDAEIASLKKQIEINAAYDPKKAAWGLAEENTKLCDEITELKKENATLLSDRAAISEMRLHPPDCEKCDKDVVAVVAERDALLKQVEILKLECGRNE